MSDAVLNKVEEFSESSDPIQKAVAAIWNDVTDRRGIKHEFEACDEDIQLSILEDWETKIGTFFR